MTETPVRTSPKIRRIRHEVRRRTLTIAATERLTPHMIRLRLKGIELHGFASLGADDHLKLIVPGPDGEEVQRDVTPRRHDAETGDLVIDVVDHPGGPAADWARAARPGDAARIGGPRGSSVIEGDIGHWLLIGDEAALPAIGRRIEELPGGASVTSLVAVPGPADEQRIPTAAAHEALWIHRPLAAAGDPLPYLRVLQGMELPERSFVWIAAETGVARTLRTHFTGIGHDQGWMKSSGYWVSGVGDAQIPAVGD